MALCFDDLEYNPFFRSLQTEYATKYEEAQKKLWLICVPCYHSLKGLAITLEFIDSHVLKPSPFFKSHFVTTDVNNSVSFEIEDGNIHTPTGSIKVLVEETAYNDDYKPFKILIIERPLSCSPPPVKEDQHSCSNFCNKGLVLPLTDCKAFLQSFPECTQVMVVFERKVKLFISSYMILPQYLQDTALKLRDISHWASQEFLSAVKMHSDIDDAIKSEIAAAIENYLLHQVHHKLFSVIKKKCLEDDKALTQKLLSLYEANITPDQLGVREPFCCQTPSAVVELASLNSKTTPAEKLQCVMTMLELLNQDIEQFLSETCSPVNSNKDNLCVTSDDLIPLLVSVIVQARPQYLISNLYYIQNFCWELSSIDKYSFGLVTFQAAKEFLKSSQFDFLKPSKRKVKKELSLEELMEVTVEMQKNSKSPSEVKPPHTQSPIDHQLENVTKMIEASTRELRERPPKKGMTAHNNRHNLQRMAPEENLGDFLSSLRQSSLGLSYGKQT